MGTIATIEELSVANLNTPKNQLFAEESVRDVPRAIGISDIGQANLHATFVEMLNEAFASGALGVGFVKPWRIWPWAPEP